MATVEAIAEEERLDEMDPLRHLRIPEGLADADGIDLLPPQPATTRQQVTELTFPPNDLRIQLVIDASPGCGGIAWPAGEVLARYICHRNQSNGGWLSGKEVLELGSGTGLVGLVAGKLGAKVIVTDQKQLLPLIESNIALNDLSDTAEALELNWGETLPPQIDPTRLSHILAADCVYFEPAFLLLVDTLCDLTRSPHVQPEILFCYKKRRKADKRFFALLKKHFDWQEVDDDPYQATYAREAISLLRLCRRRKPDR